MKMDKTKQNNIFRLLRIARNMTVKEIAELLLVTPAYIHAIENGNRVPSKRLLRDYAVVLDVSESLILDFENSDKKHKRLDEFMLYILQVICDVDDNKPNTK